MMSLQRFAINPFADRQISIDELRAFAVDHRGKLLHLATEGGDYDEMITLINAALEGFGDSVTDELTAKAIQKARTSALRTKREAILAELPLVQATVVVSGFPKGSEAHTEIFPSGLTPFRDATTDGLGDMLDSLLERLGTHSPVLGDYTNLVTLATQWKAMRGSHLQAKGDSTDSAGDRRAAADTLRDQLFDNLLAIARMNRGKPEEMTKYFSQHLLEDPETSRDDDPVPPVEG